jgi:HTH-type transcriptional regulator/antitoxin HipB
MHISSAQDVAATIRGRRQELGLSQGQLAATAGVSRDWVNQIEAGKPSAEFGLVLRVLDVLELRLDLVPLTQHTGPAGGRPVDLDDLLDDYRHR